MTMRAASTLRMKLPVAAVTLAGCDPVVNIAGANFPAWLLCAIAGVIMTAILKPALATMGIEPYLEPLILTYPCVAIVLACSVYLIFFNRL